MALDKMKIQEEPTDVHLPSLGEIGVDISRYDEFCSLVLYGSQIDIKSTDIVILRTIHVFPFFDCRGAEGQSLTSKNKS